MNNLIAERMKNVPKSFVREILKVVDNPEIISFAGGLPNSDYFPVKELQDACNKVLEEDGKNALQYSTTEGYLPLRKYIAERYKTVKGIDVSPDEVLITAGSQQGLDLLGKVFVNEGDGVLMESPGYLGAIQSFSIYQPKFHEVLLGEDGVDTEQLKKILENEKIKLFYSVPNFQNPSGATYSEKIRKETAEIINNQDIVFVEDDPYGELRFIGESLPPIRKFLNNGIMLGSFSKVCTPAFRLGWVVAKKDVMEKLVIAKQASDLHTNYFVQRVIYRYLTDNIIDDHIAKIIEVYGRQRKAMVTAIEKYFPKEVKYTRPEGGMFLWVTLPEGISSMELFEVAIKENVAFVPGKPFYPYDGGDNTLRLNYSCVNEEKIEEGIRRLADAIKKILSEKKSDYILI